MTTSPLDAVHASVDAWIRRERAGTAIPGAVIVIGSSETCLPEIVAGRKRLADSEGPERAMTADAHFDLASLTKVVVTLPMMLRLASTGALDLDAPLGTWFPNAGWFRDPSLGGVTPRALLTHTSGLPAWAPFVGLAGDRLTVVGHALASPLEHPLGTVVYSDLGFIVLGRLVEVVTGLRLDEAARMHLLAPLGIDGGVGFRPLPAHARADSADLVRNSDPHSDDLPHVPTVATERCGWRGYLLDGEVHDEAAWIMGGVAGHAGAFGTALGVARYAQAWLRHDPRIADQRTMESATQRATAARQPARGLGWVLPADALEPVPVPGATDWRAGRGYGHTGFTGTSLWIDPTLDRFCVILTNRVHPTRATGPGIVHLRRHVHDLVFGGVGA